MNRLRRKKKLTDRAWEGLGDGGVDGNVTDILLSGSLPPGGDGDGDDAEDEGPQEQQIHYAMFFLQAILVSMYVVFMLHASGVLSSAWTIEVNEDTGNETDVSPLIVYHYSLYDLIFPNILFAVDMLYFIRAWIGKRHWEAEEFQLLEVLTFLHCCIPRKRAMKSVINLERVGKPTLQMGKRDFDDLEPGDLTMKSLLQRKFAIAWLFLAYWLRPAYLHYDYNGIGSTATLASSCTRLRGVNSEGLSRLVFHPNGYFPSGGYPNIDTSDDGLIDHGFYQFCTLNRRWASTNGVLNTGVGGRWVLRPRVRYRGGWATRYGLGSSHSG